MTGEWWGLLWADETNNDARNFLNRKKWKMQISKDVGITKSNNCPRFNRITKWHKKRRERNREKGKPWEEDKRKRRPGRKGDGGCFWADEGWRGMKACTHWLIAAPEEEEEDAQEGGDGKQSTGQTETLSFLFTFYPERNKSLFFLMLNFNIKGRLFETLVGK